MTYIKQELTPELLRTYERYMGSTSLKDTQPIESPPPAITQSPESPPVAATVATPVKITPPQSQPVTPTPVKVAVAPSIPAKPIPYLMPYVAEEGHHFLTKFLSTALALIILMYVLYLIGFFGSYEAI